MSAASGVRVGTGHAVFEADQVLASGVGYRSAWAVCRPPYDDPHSQAALDDSDTASCTLLVYHWRVPATVNSNAPRTLHVTVPRVLFHPIASTEAPDRKAILLAGSDGTIVTITVPLTVQPGDEASVTAEVTEIDHLRVSGASCIASGDAGSIYLSTPGTAEVTVVALDDTGSVITSTMNFASADGGQASSTAGGGNSRSSGGWVASTFLGLFGRGSGGKSAGTEQLTKPSAASADDTVRTIIARDECCFVETGASIIAIDPTGNSAWRISKESCRDRAIAELFDAAVTSTEIWLLVRPADAATAAVITAPRDNAGGAAIVDFSFPLKSAVASSRGARATATQPQQQIRLHVGDGVKCTVVSRTTTRHLCLASTVRAAQAEIEEPHPTGVFVFASAVANGYERLELLTNHGPLTMRRGATEDLDVSVTSTAAPSGILDGSAVAMMDDRTPIPRASAGAGNMSLNLSTTHPAAVVRSPAPAVMHDASGVNDTVASITSIMARRDKPSAQYNFAGVVAAANNSGADSAWSHASDDVATRLAVNPSNWAKGDLEDEDDDGIAFVTKELFRRLQHHAALVDAVAADGGGNRATWAKLQPSTQALLLSRTESLSVLLTLRESFNAAAPGRDDARMKQFKLAVTHVAVQTRPSDAPAEASPSEVVFGNADSCATLLNCLNEAARADVHAAAVLPLPARVAAAVANMELWTAALDALDAVGQQHAHLADDSNVTAMWTAHHREGGFLGALIGHCHITAEILRAVVDAPVVDGNTNEAALHLVRCLARSLSVAMRLGRSADLNSRLLSATLFREPFYSGRIGYPHGAPRVMSDSAVAQAADDVAGRLGVEHAILPVLFAFSASDRLGWDSVCAAQGPEDIPQWGRLRQYAYTVPGFFAHVMTEFIEAHRESELEALPRVIPGRLPSGQPGAQGNRVEEVWKSVLERTAPDMLWLMDTSCDNLITASRAFDSCRVACGDNAAVHRSNTLTLANLDLVAQHEPLAPRRRLELENLCAEAQRKHLPNHANRALACNELVRLLLEEKPASASSSTWADASKLAAAAPSDQEKHDLSMRVLCSCFGLEGPQVVATATDQEQGDAARIQQIDASHTGRAVLANPILHRLINAESEQITAATDTAFAGALRAWSAAKYR